ncbi:hypothetical protein C0J52_19818 [Blattella germanica]|nr:hypothetical protein C0J52_19818 [Blattella germanica]
MRLLDNEMEVTSYRVVNGILEADPPIRKRQMAEMEVGYSTSAMLRRQVKQPQNLFTQEVGYRIEKVAYPNALEKEIGDGGRAEAVYRRRYRL